MNGAMQPIRLTPSPMPKGLVIAGLAKVGWGILAVCCLGGPVAAQGVKPDVNREAARGQPGQLSPHRAIYEFTLGKVRSEKGISALSGRMVYEFTGSACDGYTQSMRFVTRTTAASGAVSVSDQRSTSWEDDTGMRYRFQSSQ
jgi:hypothetical protein